MLFLLHYLPRRSYSRLGGCPRIVVVARGSHFEADLQLPPANQELTMRSLDFWRCENGLIRENWVLVDLLDVYHQLGVDVFERMRELTRMRQHHWSGEPKIVLAISFRSQ